MPAEFVPFVPLHRPAAPGKTSFTPAQTVPASAPAARQEARIQVKRNGDRITHILIDCRCGEHIEIECEY